MAQLTSHTWLPEKKKPEHGKFPLNKFDKEIPDYCAAEIQWTDMSVDD